MTKFTWFHNSPNVNDPLCLCSWCLQPIMANEDDENDPDRVPVRLWAGEGEEALEARFHYVCIPKGLFSSKEQTHAKHNTQ